jgi:hypothetical protein
VSEGWLPSLAIFAMCSTAFEALSAAATREILPLVPLAFRADGCAIVVAAPADDCVVSASPSHVKGWQGRTPPLEVLEQSSLLLLPMMALVSAIPSQVEGWQRSPLEVLQAVQLSQLLGRPGSCRRWQQVSLKCDGQRSSCSRTPRMFVVLVIVRGQSAKLDGKTPSHRLTSITGH